MEVVGFGLDREARRDPQLHAEAGADEDATGRAMPVRPMAVQHRLFAGPEREPGAGQEGEALVHVHAEQHRYFDVDRVR